YRATWPIAGVPSRGIPAGTYPMPMLVALGATDEDMHGVRPEFAHITLHVNGWPERGCWWSRWLDYGTGTPAAGYATFEASLRRALSGALGLNVEPCAQLHCPPAWIDRPLHHL